MDFSELYGTYFDISDVYAMYQHGNDGDRYFGTTERKTDALLMFFDAEGTCSQKDRKDFFVPCGSVVYIPRGSIYNWEVHSVKKKTSTVTLLFEFTLKKRSVMRGIKGEVSHERCDGAAMSFGNDIFVIEDGRKSLYEKMFMALIDEYNKNPFSPLGLYCAAYEILNTLAEYYNRKRVEKKDVSLILKGIAYLENDDKQEKSMAEVAAMCGVSIGYFEKLFRSYAGVSPAEYRVSQKIAQIKKYLTQTNHGLDLISENIGFCDSAYLCRIFKKKTGMTPNEYRKMTRKM